MLEYNKTITPEAVDLIKKILKVNPDERLKLNQILAHPWLKKYEKIYSINIENCIYKLNDKKNDKNKEDINFRNSKAAKISKSPPTEPNL